LLRRLLVLARWSVGLVLLTTRLPLVGAANH